jgi:hypothetical protein
MLRNKKVLLVLAFSVVVVAAIVVVLLPATGGSHQTGTWSPPANLPTGCRKPPDGYLIIADEEGFNGSKLVGSPAKSWPIINVPEGSNVDIVVCNVDPTFAHGFQIGHYFDSNIESVAPGQVITVLFVAKDAGAFQIYCSIFCPTHIFMQSGVLRVAA